MLFAKIFKKIPLIIAEAERLASERPLQLVQPSKPKMSLHSSYRCSELTTQLPMGQINPARRF